MAVENATWPALGNQVDKGTLFLERGSAQRCADACTTFIDQLRETRYAAERLGRADGFGSLPSGIALAAKFSRKAVGGPNSMVDVLTAHIAEVEAMREVFEKVEARYAAAEQLSVDGFTAIPR